MTRRLLALLAAGSFSTFAVACASATEPATDTGSDDDVVTSALDYYSTSSREYWLEGTSTVTLEDDLAGASDADKMKRAKELVALKNVQIGWFLNVLIVDKEHDEKNKDYGGFTSLVRFQSEENANVSVKDGLTYQFSYKVQAVGPKNLVAKLPGQGSSTKKSLEFKMGKVTNADLARLEMNKEWYRDSKWSGFDPAKFAEDQLESMTLTITPQTGSGDAYLAIDRLFADGEVTVGVHFGHDYHARYDIAGSRDLYNWLVGTVGFTSPVKSYAEYLRDSGPLTKTITSNGKPVKVKISIFHPADPAQKIPGPDPDTDAGGKLLEADMRESLAKREIVIFEGHSGPLYGFALANWKKTDEGDFDDSKVPTATMPSTYQIVLANGCQTYAMGEAFWKNPAKADRKSLNVITSTSFSNAGTERSAVRLIDALVNQRGGKVAATKVSDLTRGLDEDQGWGFDTMYGVHGIDANPKYDPTADRARLCQPCTNDASCGADGTRCTKVSSRQKACTFGCVDDSGCPTGYACSAVVSATSNRLKTMQCVPKSGICN
ncbi:MAG: hypothetical protein U0169_10490 [Polyangiaceae bacterium]